jgi:hypothetical protein
MSLKIVKFGNFEARFAVFKYGKGTGRDLFDSR